MATVSKQPPPQQPPSSSSPPLPLSKDDLWKRSTDCFYFLASPSTCKKGSECEYRHSETARSNPRDCWYWLNGTCSMNVNCAYRHPPLDVMVPPQVGSYAGPSSSVPQSGQPFTTKQSVPCVYFQGSGCSKGYRCPFLHGPIPQPNTRTQPAQETASANEATAFKKAFSGPEKDIQPKPSFHSNALKFIRNAAPEVEKRSTIVKHNPPRGVVEETPGVREMMAPVVGNGSYRSKVAPHCVGSVDDQYYQNGRDADDSLRESSPGFDVLVDDKLKEDEYYHEEDQYARVRSHEGRRSSELDRDYDSVPDDVYRSMRGSDAYDGLRDKYAREHRRTSSERPLAHDRRGSYKPESTDLRHRLSKQQRGVGLRSVVSPDCKPEYHPKDQGYHSSRSDARRSPMRGNSVGGRLQGRIKLPRRSPPMSDRNTYLERENERGRNLRRLSPRRPQLSPLRGRLRDRLGARVQEESFVGRSLRDQWRKDSKTQDNGDAFAAPKPLSELRDNKHYSDNKNQKLRDTVLGSSRRTEVDVSFDGPKPLSEILKRKRNAASTASTSVVNGDNKEMENGVHLTSDTTTFDEDTDKLHSGLQENNELLVTKADDEDEAKISNKKIKIIEDEASLPDEQKQFVTENEGLFGGAGEEAEIEEGLDQGDGEEAGVEEEFDQGENEFEYEHDDDVEGYNLNEGDVADNEGFVDEDDGDDFAKKLGVLL